LRDHCREQKAQRFTLPLDHIGNINPLFPRRRAVGESSAKVESRLAHAATVDEAECPPVVVACRMANAHGARATDITENPIASELDRERLGQAFGSVLLDE